jgi:hypothetical protein
MSWFIDALVQITGSNARMHDFASRCLRFDRLSLEDIEPTPPDLLWEVTNLSEDGYDALFGDWTRVMARQMLKESAKARGLAFPLESRNGVLECIQDLGDHGRTMLREGERLRMNLERHGVRDAPTWRKKHWGLDTDFEDSVIRLSDTRIEVAVLASGSPRKAVSRIAKPFRDLHFDVTVGGENSARVTRFVVKNGKAITADARSSSNDAARQFRYQTATRWLAQCQEPWAAQLAIHDRGYIVFRDTDFSVDFALSRTREGESIQSLALRFPQLLPEHLHAFEQITLRPHTNGLKICVDSRQR